MTTSDTGRSFLPAAGHDLFLPLYDPLTKILGADRVRRRLIEQATLRGGHRVLEIGCGTGTLLIDIKRRHPDVEVVGLDPDPKALDRARRKARRAGVAIELNRGFANALPYPNAAFDRVLSSLMLHHVADDEKTATLRDVLRVLKPGGRLELVDFARPASGHHGRLLRLLHSHKQLRDNSEKQILNQLTQAGFSRTRAVESTFLLGRVVFFQASTSQ